jgi:hypothetical protein
MPKNKLAWLSRKPDVKLKAAERHKTANQQTNPPEAKTAANKAPVKSRQRPLIKPAASGPPSTSSIGKYVVFGFLMISAAVFVFIINYLLTLDRSSFDDSAPTSSILKKLAADSQQSKPIEETHSRRPTLTDTRDLGKNESDGRLSKKQNKYCEIYLKGGSIILAETWWVQDNLIMYKTKHARLVKRWATFNQLNLNSVI